MPRQAQAFAPAKVNLTLHVTGRRADGYHLLDSLVVFLEIGDGVTVSAADAPSLALTGPFATEVPAGGDNLVLRAAALARVPAAILLDKRLPAAAGLGGGSSDAAATLRALAALHGTEPPVPDAALPLGADVPACLLARPLRMRGIGDDLREVEVPPLHFVLANPRVALPTAAVFAALDRRDNPPMEEPAPPEAPADFAGWLARQRNDLEAPARRLAPAVGDTLSALAALPVARLARMSGSGATCFALFDTRAAAEAAARSLAAAHPRWWTSAASLYRPSPEPVHAQAQAGYSRTWCKHFN